MRNFTLFKQLLLLAMVFVAGNTMAQTILLEEDFSKCTSTSPDNPSSKIESIDDYTLVPGWAVENAYAGNGNVKFGASSRAGSITTPALDLSDETATYTLSFKACAWSNDQTSLMVSVDEQEAVEVSGLSNAAAPYAGNMKDFSLVVKGTAASKIKIASKQASKARFFLDDVKVTKMAAGETPAPSLTAPALVSFGSVEIGVASTKEVVISGTNLTEDLSVAISGEGFSCETTTISKDEAANVPLSVVFTPAAGGEYAGELTLSGGGLAEAVVISLTGVAVDLTGEGTKENPYTVADVITLNNPNEKYWVKGVIVGFVNDSSLPEGAVLDLSGATSVSETNLLLADEAGVTDATLCIPVQLPRGEIRSALNLSTNPTNLGRELSIYGTLESYFGATGVKSPSEYVLGEGSGEVPDPTPVVTYSYKKATSIESGKPYLMVAEVEGAYKVAKPLNKDYGFLSVEDATAEGENITLKTRADEFVFTETTGGYTIMDSDARYLYQTGSYNSFNVAAAPEGGEVWTVEANADGTFKITNVSVSKYAQYSAQYTSFGSYADEQGVMPCLYEPVTGGGSAIADMEAATENAPAEVYTLGGVKVGNSLDGLAKGIYVVKQGNQVKKVIK